MGYGPGVMIPGAPAAVRRAGNTSRALQLLPWVLLLGACGTARHGAAPNDPPAGDVANVTVPAAEPADEPVLAEDELPVRPPDDSNALPTCVGQIRASGLGPDEDGARYRAAFTAEREGDADGARRLWFSLIQEYPKSPLVPLAYLAFAELFAREAAEDPGKWELAEQAYREVAKYPPAKNPAHVYARLRIGDAQRPRDELAAFATYEEAVVTALANPDAPCAREVTTRGRRALTELYAKHGAPGGAFEFFISLSDDEAQAAQLVVDVAREFDAVGERADACLTVSGIPTRARSAHLGSWITGCP